MAKKRLEPVIEKREVDLELKWIDGSGIDEGADSQYANAFRSEDRNSIDRATLKSMFYNSAWVYIVVDAIAKPLSRVPWLVYKKVFTNGKLSYVPAEMHSLNALLENPSSHVSASAFKYMLFSEDALMGNAIIWYARSMNEMHFIPSERMNYKFDKKSPTPTSVWVSSDSQDTMAAVLPFQDIIHIQRAHTSDKWWGLSPFLPARQSIQFQTYFNDSINAYWQRGAQPQGVLSLSQEANEQNSLRMLKKFEAAYSGRKNMRRTMILPKGVDYSSVANTICDQNTISLVEMNRETIINALHVPKHVVSLNQAGSLGSEEFKQALKYFWTATLIPITERVAEKMTQFFKRELGPDHVIGFDFNDIEILQEDKLKKALLAKEMLQTRTLNEVREEVWSQPALVGGDALPGQTRTANNPVLPVSQQMSQVAVNGETQGELPSATLKVPIEETKSFERNAKWFQKNALLVKMTHAIMAAEESSKIKSFSGYATKTLNVQSDLVQKALDKTLKTKAASFDEKAFQKEYDRLIKGVEKDSANEQSYLLKNTMELGYRSQLSGVFNQVDREGIEALRIEGADKRRAILTDRSLESFRSTASTTSSRAIARTKEILDEIANGVEANKTTDQIAKQVREYLNDNAVGRAGTIARTEVNTAVSLGQQAMHRDAKEVIPNLKKVWLNAGDNKVRGGPADPGAKHDHWDVHGEIIDSDAKFSNGLEYPHDPKGAAGNVINCRCVLMSVDPRDADLLDIPGVTAIPNRP